MLVTDRPDADRMSPVSHFRQEGASELFLPRAVRVLGVIPVLGSGKIDAVGAAEVAKSMRSGLGSRRLDDHADMRGHHAPAL
ncbi:MAG: hypothetical protein INF16_08790 [Methylobacterium sp.]|nr:hypothetical protein [Methylobacterium sp.]